MACRLLLAPTNNVYAPYGWFWGGNQGIKKNLPSVKTKKKKFVG
jgi:hypothetical protein